MAKSFAWSFSALTAFEQCSLKHQEVKILKNFSEDFSGPAAYGQDVHRFFELFLKAGDPLPLDVAHHQAYLEKIAAMPGTGTTEQRLALTRDLKPTGFFDHDVWVRGIADYILLTKSRKGVPTGIVFDWKTGRPKSDFEQVKLACAIVAQMRPEIEQWAGAYYWTKTKTTTKQTWSREEVLDVWPEWRRRADAMELAIEEGRFTAKPSGLCNKHCVVLSCNFNGSYTGDKNGRHNGREQGQA